jgi:hypothetical protein
MQIKVQIRTVYGVETVYPICDKAKAFASIARTKTLTPETLYQIKALGYGIVNQPAANILTRLNNEDALMNTMVNMMRSPS